VNATTGEVTALAVGTTNIRATVEGVTGQSALTVSALPAANNRFGYAWNQLPAAPIDSVYTPFALYTRKRQRWSDQYATDGGWTI
jgi:hypothetical protein